MSQSSHDLRERLATLLDVIADHHATTDELEHDAGRCVGHLTLRGDIECNIDRLAIIDVKSTIASLVTQLLDTSVHQS